MWNKKTANVLNVTRLSEYEPQLTRLLMRRRSHSKEEKTKNKNQTK